MTNPDDEMSSSDRILMMALAEAIGAQRSPIDLAARCQGLLSWIDVDSELADLLDQPVAEAAGTRGAAAPTTALEFAVEDRSCVIELTPSENVLRGQVLGGEVQAVVVRTITGTTLSVPVSDLGAFEFSNPPSGTIRLELAFAEGRRIHTAWFVI